MSDDSDDREPAIRARDSALADAIGSLFINFALLNAYINGAVSAQLSLTLEQARALVLPLQPRPKVEMLQWYADLHWSKSEIEMIKDLCGRTKTLADFRNHIAHSDMVLEDPDGDVHLVSYSGKHRFSPKKQAVTPKDVAQAAMVAQYLAREFRILGLRIQNKQIALKDDPPPRSKTARQKARAAMRKDQPE